MSAPDLMEIAAMSGEQAAELEQQLVTERGRLRHQLQRQRLTPQVIEAIEEQVDLLTGRIRACRRRASAAEIDSRSKRINELEQQLRDAMTEIAKLKASSA